ncbi:hypothetical protein AOC36_03085 [Erysipelothrix larvae]|uniref:N-acetyltransferase domain-containing protein n=1 Tax=Erysipelothrix larvae TaxID=1514105 RepID=A0A109UGP8_9FIRM|nr:GNAT family N-acetyltransferase [Erysipelothrix larvae]AMC93002.1 hypothetical protein AOC36_03085 [Erysipelothrix larvae]
MVKLIKLSSDYTKQIQDYKDAFNKRNESIHGCAGINHFPHVTDWIAQSLRDEHQDTVQPGFVPAFTYCLVDMKDQSLVGIVNIRTQLNESLRNFGGHIGYSIHPDKRGQGYGKLMLHLALEKCKTYGICDVLVTANDTNIASIKVIEGCGGQFENILFEEDTPIRRYWFHL